jgi:hypothetical protein
MQGKMAQTQDQNLSNLPGLTGLCGNKQAISVAGWTIWQSLWQAGRLTNVCGRLDDLAMFLAGWTTPEPQTLTLPGWPGWPGGTARPIEWLLDDEWLFDAECLFDADPGRLDDP